MRLLSLSMKNFKRVRTRQTIPLANRGLVVVVGENGVGKTTLIDGVLWCLSGRTLEGHKANDVVNETAGRNCHVRVNFEDAAGTVWRVDRYRNHRKHRNRVYLFSAKANRSQHLSADTEANIERIIGMDFSALAIAMVVGQGVLAPFSSMNATEQSRVIDNITGTSVLHTALDLVRKKKGETLRNIVDVQSKAKVYKAKLSTLKQHFKETRKTLRSTKQHIARYKSEQKKIVSKLHEARNAEKETKTLREKLEKWNEVVEVLLRDEKAEHAALVREEQLLRQLQKKEAHYKSKKAGVACPECGSVLSEQTIKSQLEETQKAYVEQSKVHNAIQIRYDKINKMLQAAKSERNKIKFDAPQSAKAVELELDRWISAGKAARKSYVEAKESLSRIRRDHKKARQDYEQSKLETHRLEKKVSYLEHAEKEFNRDLPLDLQESLRPFLNKTAARYSQAITDGYVKVEFETAHVMKSGVVKEGLCVNANNVRGSSSYRLQSKGEKQKIDIVVASTLQALSAETVRTSVNVAFYDEVFDSLDAASVERVIQFMQEELKHRESVFIITHNSALQSHFSNVIEVYKKQDQTIIQDCA